MSAEPWEYYEQLGCEAAQLAAGHPEQDSDGLATCCQVGGRPNKFSCIFKGTVLRNIL
jgi:hypothetical protein